MSHDAANAEGNDTISWNRHFGVPLKILVHSCLLLQGKPKEPDRGYISTYLRCPSDVALSLLASSANGVFALIAPPELALITISTS